MWRAISPATASIVLQVVGPSVTPVGRGADGNELHLRVLHRLGRVGGEAQPTFSEVALDDRLRRPGSQMMVPARSQLILAWSTSMQVSSRNLARHAPLTPADVAGTGNAELHGVNPVCECMNAKESGEAVVQLA